jgi:putative endonuclease
MKARVYILECSDGSYYVGCTTNLSQRIEQHDQGLFSGYTSKRRPLVLKWSGETNDINNAIAAERQIKGWSRAKKEALIRGDWKALHELSLSKEIKQRKAKQAVRIGLSSTSSRQDTPGLRFTSSAHAKRLASYLGIAPLQHTSGTSVFRASQSRHFGPATPRKLLYLASCSVVTHNPEFRKYFLRKTAEGKSPRLVLNNVANKLLKLVCALIRSQQSYIPNYRSVNPLLLKTT